MARGILPLTQISRAGVAPVAETAGDAVNGHQASNDGSMFVLLHNTNSGSTARTATIHLAESVDGQAVAPRTVAVPAASSRYVGPFPESQYGAAVLVDVDNAELHLSAYHL